MKKIFLIWSEMNQIGFGVEVEEEDVEKAVELAQEGFDRWNWPDEYPEYHDVGYAEPSMELMDEAGIKYKIIDTEELTDPDDPDYWRQDVDFVFTSMWGWTRLSHK